MSTVKLVPDYLKLEKFKLSSVHQEIANINQQVQISAMTLPTHNTPPALQNILSNVSDLVKELDFDVKNFLDADSRGAALTFIEKIRKYKKEIEDFTSIATQFAGIGLLMNRSVTFHYRGGKFRNKKYSYRTKAWLKKANGKYPNKIANSIDKFIKAKPQNILTKQVHTLFGFNKGYTNPGHYIKGHLLGLPQNSTYASMKTIAKSVSKRFGGINVVTTSADEFISLSKKINQNKDTSADYGVFTSNVVIKSTGTYLGAAAGATLMSFAGPPGVIIGGMAGGYFGGLAADVVAKRVENTIRDFDHVKDKADHILKDSKKIGKLAISEGKSWVKGWFK